MRKRFYKTVNCFCLSAYCSERLYNSTFSFTGFSFALCCHFQELQRGKKHLKRKLGTFQHTQPSWHQQQGHWQSLEDVMIGELWKEFRQPHSRFTPFLLLLYLRNVLVDEPVSLRCGLSSHFF